MLYTASGTEPFSFASDRTLYLFYQSGVYRSGYVRRIAGLPIYDSLQPPTYASLAVADPFIIVVVSVGRERIALSQKPSRNSDGDLAVRCNSQRLP